MSDKWFSGVDKKIAASVEQADLYMSFEKPEETPAAGSCIAQVTLSIRAWPVDSLSILLLE